LTETCFEGVVGRVQDGASISGQHQDRGAAVVVLAVRPAAPLNP
jgi:hypothetical protein